ncbi:MAG: hypothetical protein V7K64_22550 [Nostoc sp.]|uniref:hypothetical protein n=1 Tax=unclassified Nostoc TaxID=2593658 RepID=UPI001DF5D0F7|nr:hypothetical protein [Nostoc sp. JL34]MBN3881657.1 hypothetical protein [Nostoc sp. JL34]
MDNFANHDTFAATMAVVKNTSFMLITQIFATPKCELPVSSTEAFLSCSFLLCAEPTSYIRGLRQQKGSNYRTKTPLRKDATICGYCLRYTTRSQLDELTYLVILTSFHLMKKY